MKDRKTIPLFINHFGIKNVDLMKMFAEKNHKVSESQISQKLNIDFTENKFNPHELYLLRFIEKEFLNEYRRKLVTYKTLKFRENDKEKQ